MRRRTIQMLREDPADLWSARIAYAVPTNVLDRNSSMSFRAYGPVGVGIAMARDPLRRSGRALLTHPAPTLGDDA